MNTLSELKEGNKACNLHSLFVLLKHYTNHVTGSWYLLTFFRLFFIVFVVSVGKQNSAFQVNHLTEMIYLKCGDLF